MFEFDAELESLENVPKQYQGLYTKSAEGKYAIDAELGKKLDTSGLNSALVKERTSVKELKAQLGGYSKLGKVEELQQRLEAAGAGDKQYEKLKKDLETSHAAQLQERDEVTTRMRKALDTHLVDGQAAAAIAEAKGSSVLLLPHVRAHVRVVEESGEFVTRVVDAEGEPRMNGKGGYMTPADLVAELKKKSEFAPAFASSGASGGGMPPGKGGSGNGAGNLTGMQKISMGLKNQR